MRERLRNGDALSSNERERFAGSIVSIDDVALLKRLTSVERNPEIAGDALMALFSRGGIANLNTEIRAWFETTGNEDTGIFDAAPVVLGASVRQLDDGTALRQLFEFSYNDDVKLVLDQILEDAHMLPLERMLQQSITQQVDRLIEERGQSPSNRFLWILRTYGWYEHARTYLSSWALAGRVSALVSHAVCGSRLDWGYIDAAKPEDEFDMRLLVNVGLDNLARGAERRAIMSSPFVSRLSARARSEFADGLSIL